MSALHVLLSEGAHVVEVVVRVASVGSVRHVDLCLVESCKVKLHVESLSTSTGQLKNVSFCELIERLIWLALILMMGSTYL